MKKYILVYLIALITIQSCNKEEVFVPTCENCNFTCLELNEPDVITNDCIDNWSCEFKIVQQSEVNLKESLGYSSGNKVIIKMSNTTEGDLTVADDEYYDTLIFELSDLQNSFAVEDSEMTNLKVHFKRSCFCEEWDFKEVTTGCIQGEKQADETWQIQGKIVVPYEFRNLEIKFKAKFEN